MPRPRRILVVADLASLHRRQIVHGVAQACRNAGVGIVLEARPDRLLNAVAAVRPDGLVVHHGDYGMISQVTGIPVVSTLYNSDGTPWPVVCVDNQQVGRIAAEHLVECGFRAFAVLGQSGPALGKRTTGFVDAVMKAGFHCEAFAEEVPYDSGPDSAQVQRLARWLKALPRPLGLFVPKNNLGVPLVQTLQAAGTQVPEDVGIVGAQNDDLTCNLAAIPLSSVDCNGLEIGRRAVALLLDTLAGKHPPQRTEIVPRGVVVRQSTDVQHTASGQVGEWVGFIRAQACKGIDVEDITEHFAVSRSTLERGFRREVGRSPGDVIRRVQARRAMQLLAETDMSLPAIARAVGLGGRERLNDLIRSATGTTPAEYRREQRGGEDPVHDA